MFIFLFLLIYSLSLPLLGMTLGYLVVNFYLKGGFICCPEDGLRCRQGVKPPLKLKTRVDRFFAMTMDAGPAC